MPVQPSSVPPAAASPGVSRARRPGAEPAPFAVVSLSVPGVTLLLEGRPGPRAARIARDLFGAAGARWDAEPAYREFDWPPAPGLPVVTGPDAARRALGAFVEKELADHQPRLLLVAESLAARLDTTPAGIRRVLLPDLDRLAVDAQAKRKVWSALAQWLRDGGAADGRAGR